MALREFHDAVHGLQAKRGTGTAIIKFKLLTQYTTKICGVDEKLYLIFLNLQKAYYTLDRTRASGLLQ